MAGGWDRRLRGNRDWNDTAQSQNSWSHQNLEETRNGFSFRAFGENLALPTPWFWPPGCKRINFCCSETLNLWRFVTAATGNWCLTFDLKKNCTYLMYIFCGFEHILDKYPEVGLLDHMVVLFSIFWGNFLVFYTAAVQFCISTKSVQGGASLVAQWLRIRLPMQGTQVRALVRKDPTCRGATNPVCHNYWACTLEPGSHNYRVHVLQLLKPTCLEPVLRNKRIHHNEKPAHRNKE